MQIRFVTPAYWKKVLPLSLVIGICLQAHAQSARGVALPPGLAHMVSVPLDYTHPELGAFDLYYELGKPFDRHKPTVFVIADGQQFFVRKGAIPPLQDEIFGDKLNVVGIVGRGFNEDVLQRVQKDGSVDWAVAYELLKSDQWIEDIDRVRIDLLGQNGRIILYGRSGGGLLVHQYLAQHPDHVDMAFTQAAVNRFLDTEFGLKSDTFWTELGAYDKTLQPLLLGAIHKNQQRIDLIMLLLQRQNFFVPADQIDAERARLLHALDTWDESVLRYLTKLYQVDAILDSLKSPQAAAERVRVFELFAPVLNPGETKREDIVDPDYEVGRIIGAPLFALLGRGQIKPPQLDTRRLHQMQGQVYLLAGRYDHTADYRSQIALASCYKNHRLLLLSDDHDFLNLKKTGLYPKLLQAVLRFGLDTPQLAAAEALLKPLIYREY